MVTSASKVLDTPQRGIQNLSDTTLFTAQGIGKSFGGAIALRSVDFDLRSGEVHGLLGANGAGKSTLSKIITGHIHANSGLLTYRGQQLTDHSVRAALDLGITMVAQETSLAPDLSVLENIFLPELGKPGRINWARMRARGRAILDELGGHHDLPLDQPVWKLSSAGRQMVEIAKALALDASLIIFDEPTAALSTSEVDGLFKIISQLKNAGKGLVFVSHRLEEVLDITDRVSVLREGENAATGLDTSTLDQAKIIRHMVGRSIDPIRRGCASGASAAPKPLLEVSGLAAGPMVQNVSFTLNKGEILGIGGLVGAGRTETVEAIFGLRKCSAGKFELDGARYTPRDPRHAISSGICLVPEDRRYQSIVPDLSVKENMMLAHIGRDRAIRLNYRAIEAEMDSIIATLELPRDRLDQSLLGFSGGMQQKVIIARWLLMQPKVLILDEPTKGVDIQTRQSIYKLLTEVAKKGVGILVISSDFEELIHISDRIVVMSDGTTISDLPGQIVDEEGLTLLCAPRSSSEQNYRRLSRFASQFGGQAFWMLKASDQAMCLHVTHPELEQTVGLQKGHMCAQTALPFDLEGGIPRWQHIDTMRKFLIVSERLNARGHSLGYFGLVVDDTDLPSEATILEYLDGIDTHDTAE